MEKRSGFKAGYSSPWSPWFTIPPSEWLAANLRRLRCKLLKWIQVQWSADSLGVYFPSTHNRSESTSANVKHYINCCDLPILTQKCMPFNKRALGSESAHVQLWDRIEAAKIPQNLKVHTGRLSPPNADVWLLSSGLIEDLGMAKQRFSISIHNGNADRYRSSAPGIV